VPTAWSRRWEDLPMKLGRVGFATPEGLQPRIVAVLPEQNRVVDLLAAEALRLRRRGAGQEAAARIAAALFPPSMAAALAAGPRFREAAEEALSQAGDDTWRAIGDQTWLPALDPPVMRDCLLFEGHLRNSFAKLGLEIPREFFEAPPYYKGNPRTLVGHDAEIAWPAYASYMDYELELGIVTGASGRNLDPEQARSLLFGVTILNDFSARNVQAREMNAKLGPSKSKDFATALGPWITTADEVDVNDLTLRARVNGEEWSRGNSADMIFRPDEILAFISYGETVGPGELIGSGTVSGGCGLELGRQLNPGDVVELDISGIGTLRNRLGPPEHAGWDPASKVVKT